MLTRASIDCTVSCFAPLCFGFHVRALILFGAFFTVSDHCSLLNTIFLLQCYNCSSIQKRIVVDVSVLIICAYRQCLKIHYAFASHLIKVLNPIWNSFYNEPYASIIPIKHYSVLYCPVLWTRAATHCPSLALGWRLSWAGCLVKHRGGLPARRRSP